MDVKPCHDHCCSSFITFKDELVTKTPDLTVQIHPIYRRSNFKFNSDEDYELMRPSLQLASLMIQSDAVLPYIMRTFDGEVRTGGVHSIPLSQHHFEMTDDEMVSDWDVHLAARPDQTEVNTQNRQRVSQILTHFAEMLDIDVRNQREDDNLAHNVMGYVQIQSGCLTQSMQAMFPRGSRSYMLISREYLDNLKLCMSEEIVQASEHHDEGCTPSQRKMHSQHHLRDRTCWACFRSLELLCWRFHLAETLVHELGHALWRASCGGCWEIPHTHGSCAESGFELISQLFGGVVYVAPDLNNTLPLETGSLKGMCNKSKPYLGGIGPMVTLSEWPNTAITASYLAGGYAHSDFTFAATPDAKYRVPFSYLEDLFSQSFWEKVHADGPEALKPPRRGTLFFHWKAANKLYQWCTAAETAKLLAERGISSRGKLDRGQLDLSLDQESQVERQAKRKRQVSYVPEPDEIPAKAIPRFLDFPTPYAKP